MIQVIDGRDGHVISRHRNLTAAMLAADKYVEKIKKKEGVNVPITINTALGKSLYKPLEGQGYLF